MRQKKMYFIDSPEIKIQVTSFDAPDIRVTIITRKFKDGIPTVGMETIFDMDGAGVEATCNIALVGPRVYSWKEKLIRFFRSSAPEVVEYWPDDTKVLNDRFNSALEELKKLRK